MCESACTGGSKNGIFAAFISTRILPPGKSIATPRLRMMPDLGTLALQWAIDFGRIRQLTCQAKWAVALARFTIAVPKPTRGKWRSCKTPQLRD